MAFRLLAQYPVGTGYLNMASTNVTTSAWVQLIASTPAACSAVEIFNPASATMQVAIGAAGSEVPIPYTVLPGGSAILLPMEIPAGSRISLKAVDQTANSNVFSMNLFG